MICSLRKKIFFGSLEEARLKHEKEEMERLEIQRIEKEKWNQLEAKVNKH